MPYSIETKDNIVIDNIPDNVAPDSQEIRDQVAKIRATKNSSKIPPDQMGSLASDRPGILKNELLAAQERLAKVIQVRKLTLMA